MNESVLRVEDVHKAFGPLQVLKGVSLQVSRGQVVAVLGPSGCGKSTLLRCINYLERPDRGCVWLRGELMGHREVGGKTVSLPERALDQQRARIGVVFQRLNLFPHMTVLGNVIEAPILVKRLPRPEAEGIGLRLLERFDLLGKKDEYPHRLSGGQQQRVAIARALAMNPELMLFDEPTSALDPELIGEVLQAIKELAAEGMTMVIVTHEIEFAREVAQRVVFLDHGVVLAEGTPAEILDTSAQPRIQDFLRRTRRKAGR
jgi:polar amino acid transport system ATP-binding protein